MTRATATLPSRPPSPVPSLPDVDLDVLLKRLHRSQCAPGVA